MFSNVLLGIMCSNLVLEIMLIIMHYKCVFDALRYLIVCILELWSLIMDSDKKVP
jgi:hypothetical protein